MNSCRLLILTALHPEAKALARTLKCPAPSPNSPSRKGDIALALIGLRARSLPHVPKTLHPQAIIMAGLAGALAPHLKIGDIIISPPPTPHSSIRQLVNSSVHPGQIHTSPTLISTPEQKQTLFKNTGALAVDMETDYARDLAAKLHIPFLAIRSISDTASQHLDPKLLALVDDYGRPRTTRALASLARNPKSLPNLLRLKRATDLALKNLATTLKSIVDSGWPDPPPKAKIP